MGDRFNLGRFHEAVLANGSVPVKHLPELVRARLGKSNGRPTLTLWISARESS